MAAVIEFLAYNHIIIPFIIAPFIIAPLLTCPLSFYKQYVYIKPVLYAVFSLNTKSIIKKFRLILILNNYFIIR